MTELLGILLPLLAPVAALLFLNLRLSRRLRYPLDFIVEERRRGPASFLFRSLRSHYDIILDALIALVLSLALLEAAGTPRPEASRRGKRALVLDCSRSMLAGVPGSRPLDLALKRLEGETDLREREAFALAFDPVVRKSRLYDLDKLLDGRTGESAAIFLSSEVSFFSVDYAELALLRRRGYRDILLLTDRLPGRPEGFRVLELGFPGGFQAYPSAVRYDRLSETYLIALAEEGARGPLKVGVWNAGAERFEPLSATRYQVEERPAGRLLRLSGPGIYLLSLEGPYGELGADFPLRLDPGKIAAQAEGSFSELILSAFPLLEAAPRPRLVLADAGSKKTSGSETALRITTALEKKEGAYLLDPALSGGRPIAAALIPGADFALGPAALANEDLILAYDGAIRAGLPPPFMTSLPQGTRRLVPAGSAFVAIGPRGAMPLIPEAEEYFRPEQGRLISIPSSGPRRPLWAALLALLALLKLLVWRVVSGKPFLTRD